MATTSDELATAPLDVEPMLPTPYRIQRIRQETDDTFTLELVPADSAEGFSFAPGQFNMLYVYGVGEVPISISSDPSDAPLIQHTTRVVGTVTKAMRLLKRGDMLGIRGPFGTHWPVEDATGRDVVIVAGGIGLAPLRPALYRLMAQREKYRKIVLLYGTRTPEDILYRHELEHWRGKFDLEIQVTVDRRQQLAGQCWRGDHHDSPGPVRPFQHRSFNLRTRGDDALYRDGIAEARGGERAHVLVIGTQYEMRHRIVRTLPVRASVHLQGRPGVFLRSHRRTSRQGGGLRWPSASPNWQSGSSPHAMVAS